MSVVERSDDEATRLQRARAGDVGAASALYDRYAPDLFTLAFTVTGDAAAAAAAVLEAVDRTCGVSVSTLPVQQPWHELARQTLAICRETDTPGSVPAMDTTSRDGSPREARLTALLPRQRALLDLTLDGDTHRESPVELGYGPRIAAEMRQTAPRACEGVT